MFELYVIFMLIGLSVGLLIAALAPGERPPVVVMAAPPSSDAGCGGLAAGVIFLMVLFIVWLILTI